MENTESKTLKIKKPFPADQRANRPKAIRISQEALIETKLLESGKMLPLVIRPAVDGIDLASWAASNRDFIETVLLNHGGILFRDFNVKPITAFEQFIKATSAELLEYRERSSPRHMVSDRIYTSTDYPANQSIFLHNENSYQQIWPLKIFFSCMTAAQEGGETPIADTRKVFARISPSTKERFMQKGWMYVRNFGDGYGLPWQTVFQTSEKAAVEEYCSRAGIEVYWKDSNRLRTRAVRPAVARHPRTGEMIWFNHAAFFHASTLESSVYEALVSEFNEEDLPTNTYYGDGSRIEDSVLDELREAYRQETVSFPWQQGDILMLDNMLTAHGRAPFIGPRKIVVGMAEPLGWKDIQ